MRTALYNTRMDTITKEHRSWNMSRIKSKNTSPELAVRKALSSFKIRYRLHSKTLPGKPDITISKNKIAIFINGCFWHQHPGCKRKTMPKTNVKYWKTKLENNIKMQKKYIQEIKKLTWKVLVIWE